MGPTDITFRGTLTSSIFISVTGSIDQQGGVATVITGSGIQGVVNFGTYDLAGPLLTGEKHRANKPPKGTYLVATLTVETRFSGGGSMMAAVDLQRSAACGPAPDVPCDHLFFAKMVPRKPRQKATWPRWKEYPETNTGVFLVPQSTYVPGTGNLDDLMLNGDTMDHQVAVWIPDSGPPGPFATVVTYTATRL